MSTATTVSQRARRFTSTAETCSSDVVALLDSIVPSAEPAVVFSSVAQLCAPQICSSVIVAISEAGECSYTIVNPPGPGPRPRLTGPDDPDDPDAIVVASGIRVARNSIVTGIRGPATAYHCAYDGVLVLSFRQSDPAQALLARLVADRAVAQIAHERLREIAARHQSRTEHLTSTQRSSRDIGIAVGIVMTRYELSEADALDLLSTSSLDTHRKIREVARDVAHSGRFDIPGRAHVAGRAADAGTATSVPLRASW